MTTPQRIPDRPAEKTAVLALTPAGAELAGRLATAWRGKHPVTLFAPAGPLGKLVPQLWGEYDSLVLIMAVGIAVRVVAPLLESKWSDPGVVVVDEGGNFAVSLLGGHWGGANRLAREVAALLGATPVVTTATEVQGRPAIDLLAREWGFIPFPRERVKKVNSALLAGEQVTLYSRWDLGEATWGEQLRVEPWDGHLPAPVPPEGLPVWVTGRVPDPLPPEGLFLCPPCLVAGVGCRRGVAAGELLDALDAALRLVGWRRESLRLLASHRVKETEGGLREAAASLGLPLVCFDSAVLQEVLDKHPGLQESGFVKSQVGVGGVCETAALAAARDGRLILPKTRFGRVTVALARDGWLWSASGRAIRHI